MRFKQLQQLERANIQVAAQAANRGVDLPASVVAKVEQQTKAFPGAGRGRVWRGIGIRQLERNDTDYKN